MTLETYLGALKCLGLLPCAQATAAELGLSVRQLQRIAGGKAKVPETIARLLEARIALRARAIRAERRTLKALGGAAGRSS